MRLILCLAAVAIIYVTVLPSNHSEAEDAVRYMVGVRDGVPALHPNHLLFEPMHVLWTKAIGLTGLTLGIETTMQLLSVIFSILALGMTYLLVTDRNSPTAGVLAIAVLGSSFGFWYYSIEADTYIAPLACALLAIWLGTRHASAVLIGVVLAATVLLHQMYVFLAILIPAMTVLAGLREADRWRRALIIGGVSGFIVLAVYYLGYTIADPGIPFLTWVRGLAADGLWTPFSAATAPIKAVVGFLTAIVSTNIAFAFPAAEALLNSLFPNVLFVEEAYVATTAISTIDVVISVIAIVVLAAAGLGILFASWRGRGTANETDKMLLAFVGLYALLATIWEPTNREFWIHVVAGLIIWLARRTNFAPRTTVLAWGSTAAALFVINFLTAIEPYTRPESDYWRVANAPLLDAIRPGDLVITDCGYICRSYLQLYGQAKVAVPSIHAPDMVMEAQKVWLASWALTPPEGVHNQMNWSARTAFLDRIAELYGPFPDSSGDTQRFWQLTETGWTPLN